MRTKSISAISDRPSNIDKKYIDLGPFYNFSLSEEIHGKHNNTIPIPSGITDFNGISFDVRGIIQLASKVSFEKSYIPYPETVSEIPVNQKAKRLSFLHSSAWLSKTGENVAFILINYRDGQHQIIPIQYQIEVEDWWFHPENSSLPPKADIAWEGINDRVKELGYVLKIYSYTWINPFPELEITSIDLISAMNNTGYMLYGITCS